VRFSAPFQTGSGAHPASCTMGTGSSPGIKRPGHGVDRPPQSSAEVKERVKFLLPLWAFMACPRVSFLLFYFMVKLVFWKDNKLAFTAKGSALAY